jgi:hypothetical protein
VENSCYQHSWGGSTVQLGTVKGIKMSEDQKKCNALKRIYHTDFRVYEKGSFDYEGGECGEPAAYRIKYDQGVWPMNFGRVAFCEACAAKLWQELKDLLDL